MVKKDKKSTVAAKRIKNRAVVVSSRKNLTEYYVPVLVLLLLVASFFIGRLSAQVEALKKGVGTAPAVVPTAQQPTQPTVTQEQVKGLFDGKNITFGKKDSKLVFVEFSDPSCPWCHVAGGKNPEVTTQMGKTLSTDGGDYLAPVPEMKKLVDQGKAAFVWVYANGHGAGEMGTKALYCANEKGKFWQAHDLLMTSAGYNLLNNTVKNDKTKSAALAEFLKGVVSYNDIKSCLDSGKYDDRISTDMGLAQQFGFNGTPSFFVNTTNFAGAYSFDDMRSVVEAALK
jgi:protein-disulfide isomerase